jgi:hypothetical protein
MLSRLPAEQRKQAEASRAEFDATPTQQQLRAQVDASRERIKPIGPFEPALSLEKTWHILHYLFTGHIWGPASAPGDLLLSGQGLGEDVGYGPARLCDSTATGKFNQFIETQDLSTLQRRVNFNEMKQLGVYGLPFGRRTSESEYDTELRDAVAQYFPLLREYVRRMSEKGNGLLLWIS